MQSMKVGHVLVTGASGAVGSAVVKRLVARGVRVRALVRRVDAELDSAVEQVRGDLVDGASLRGIVGGAQAVVHCAAAIGADGHSCERVNVEGARELLREMAAAGCRQLVHLSTLSVYDTSERRQFDEDAPLWASATSPYGYTKAEAERLVRAAGQSGLRAVILRAGLVLSMHRRSRWGPGVFERARESEAPIFPATVIPHVHVDNLVDAIELGLEREAALDQAFNVIDGEADVDDYFAVVYPAIGRDIPHLPAGAPRLRFERQKIRASLGYAPRDRWLEFLGALRSLAASTPPAPGPGAPAPGFERAEAAPGAQRRSAVARGARSSGG
jgi:nucleoside-diphosphate-sugar epimerase